jgi:hypothetical protein
MGPTADREDKASMTKSPGRCSFRFATLHLFAFPISLNAQAAAEYALKSGGGVGQTSHPLAIGTCPVDSDVLTCLIHAYPDATIGIGIVVCVLLARSIYGGGGYSR